MVARGPAAPCERWDLPKVDGRRAGSDEALRTTDQVALPEPDPELLKGARLAFGLDALSNQFAAVPRGEIDQPGDEALTQRVGLIPRTMLRSSFTNCGRSSRMWRRLANPAPASSTATRRSRRSSGQRGAEGGVVVDRRMLGQFEDDRPIGRTEQARQPPSLEDKVG